MASSRSNKPGSGGKKKDVKFVKSTPTSSKRAPKKAVRGAVSHTVVKPSSKASSKKSADKKKSAAFRGERTNVSWNDLAKSNDKKKSAHPEAESYLGTLSTARFAAVLLSILTLFTLYVGHVLTSQDLLKDVQTLQRENQTMTLRLNQLRAEEDEMAGPSDIFERARALGLTERAPQGKPIILN